MNNIKINFFEDWIKILKSILVTNGYSLDPDLKSEEIGIQYFNYKKRLIESKKRQFLISDVFACPPEYEAGLEIIKQKVIQGIDLTPHLSTKINNLEYNDGLLNDWGIYHLHLGISFTPNGFITRTGPLLFARVDNANFYCVQIGAHNDFTDKDLLEIIERNWPDSISEFKFGPNLGLIHHLTEKEIKDARKSGVNCSIELSSGNVYSPPGGGIASNAKSSEAIGLYLSRKRFLKLQEENFRTTMVEKLIREKKVSSKNFDFRLSLDHDQVAIKEFSNKINLGHFMELL